MVRFIKKIAMNHDMGWTYKWKISHTMESQVTHESNAHKVQKLKLNWKTFSIFILLCNVVYTSCILLTRSISVEQMTLKRTKQSTLITSVKWSIKNTVEILS